MTKIFINPGHSKDGKPDCGCAYNGIRECDMAAKIAQRLELCLKFNGFETQVYQQTGYDNNANKQLNSVASLANASRADLFISIHMNGFANETAKGTETIYLGTSTKGKLIASYVNNELIRPYKTYTFANRGAKADVRGLAVLKYTNMPAVLTEIGFISNKQECQVIVNNQNIIAQRLCDAICKYFNKAPKTYQEPQVIVESNYPQEIVLIHVGDGKYDLNVDKALKLNGNKLTTCVDWIKKTYG